MTQEEKIKHFFDVAMDDIVVIDADVKAQISA